MGAGAEVPSPIRRARVPSVFAALSLLAGCAAAAIPPAPPRLVPVGAPAFVVTAPDGAQLPLRLWTPPTGTPPRAAILAVHGMNDHGGSFARVGEMLAQRGFAVFAYDQRGFGGAPERGLWPGAGRLVADLAAASREVRARHPGIPLALMGESMGGAVVAAAVSGAAGAPRPEFDAVILSAPAVWSRSTMAPVQRGALWLAGRIAPEARLTGEGIRVRVTDNVAVARDLFRDPLVIKGTRVDAIVGLTDLMDLAFAAVPVLPARTLWLYGAKDDIIPRGPTEAALAQGLPAGARLAWYENGYHLLTRDLGGAVVIGDIAAWLVDPAAPLPSGADRAGEARP